MCRLWVVNYGDNIPLMPHTVYAEPKLPLTVNPFSIPVSRFSAQLCFNMSLKKKLLIKPTDKVKFPHSKSVFHTFFLSLINLIFSLGEILTEFDLINTYFYVILKQTAY